MYSLVNEKDKKYSKVHYLLNVDIVKKQIPIGGGP